MAIIDLGKVSITWQGTYAGGTAYTPKDAVVYNNASYICIANTTGNLPTDTSYWNVLAAKGTDGDTFSLANKEIAFKTNAGALDGIPIGTAGQALKVNSGATGYEFGAVAGGKVLQVVTNHDNTEKDLSTGTTMTNYSELNTSITPSASSSKILVMVNFGAIQYGHNDSSLGFGKVMYQISGGSVQDMAGSEQLGANNTSAGGKHQFAINLTNSNYQVDQTSMCLLHEPNTTTATSYQVFVQAESGSGVCKINKNYRNNSNDCSTISTMTLMEIGA